MKCSPSPLSAAPEENARSPHPVPARDSTIKVAGCQSDDHHACKLHRDCMLPTKMQKHYDVKTVLTNEDFARIVTSCVLEDQECFSTEAG